MIFKDKIRARAIKEYNRALHEQYLSNMNKAMGFGNDKTLYRALVNLDLEEIDNVARELLEKEKED